MKETKNKISKKIKAGIKNSKKPKTKTKSAAKSKDKKLTKPSSKSMSAFKSKKPAAKAKSKSVTKPGKTSVAKLKTQRNKPKIKTIKRKKETTTPKTINFEIDGQECVGKTGQSIVEAARDNSIYIPVLCYYKGMKPAGICRICTVRIGGRNTAACTTPIAEGMIIESNIPELENMRKSVVEMLFVEGNHMCPTCEKSGNCELQALGYRYKILVPRFPYQFPQRQIDATYSKIMIENNRCVQCRRCIRDIVTKDGRHIFAMINRSRKSTIIADSELEAQMSDELAQKAMDQCPVGTIIKKEVGFAVPIGKRKYDTTPIGSDI